MNFKNQEKVESIKQERMEEIYRDSTLRARYFDLTNQAYSWEEMVDYYYNEEDLDLEDSLGVLSDWDYFDTYCWPVLRSHNTLDEIEIYLDLLEITQRINEFQGRFELLQEQVIGIGIDKSIQKASQLVANHIESQNMRYLGIKHN